MKSSLFFLLCVVFTYAQYQVNSNSTQCYIGVYDAQSGRNKFLNMTNYINRDAILIDHGCVQTENNLCRVFIGTSNTFYIHAKHFYLEFSPCTKIYCSGDKKYSYGCISVLGDIYMGDTIIKSLSGEKRAIEDYILEEATLEINYNNDAERKEFIIHLSSKLGDLAKTIPKESPLYDYMLNCHMVGTVGQSPNGVHQNEIGNAILRLDSMQAKSGQLTVNYHFDNADDELLNYSPISDAPKRSLIISLLGILLFAFIML